MTLGWHIARLMALRFLAAGVMIVALLQMLDLLDVTTDILDRGLGFSGVVYYATLRLPRLVEQAAPLAVLAGALFAFAQLAREHAITALRAAGTSTYRLVGMALPAVAGVIIVQAAIGQLISPRTDRELNTWWQATAPPEKVPETGRRPVRVGPDIATLARGSDDGKTVRHLTIYRRGQDGRLIERITAPSAAWTPSGWVLDHPAFTRIGATAVTTGQAGDMTWPARLSPADVVALFAPDQQQTSAAAARRALAGAGSERSPAFYRVQIQRAYAGPLSSLVMLLLTAPVALASFRSGRAAWLMTGAVAAGLMFMVVDGMLTAVGESGALSAVLAAWSAPAIFATLGVTALLYLEG